MNKFNDSLGVSRDQLALAQIKNAFIFPNIPKPNKVGEIPGTSMFNKTAGGSHDLVKNLSNLFIPVPPTRQAEDPNSWREAVVEAERSVIPHRVKMQEIFRDTSLNAHVSACLIKRRNLTLLRKFALCDPSGNIDQEWTNYLNKTWFRKFLGYAIDARFFGYSLVSLGDIYKNDFNDLTIIRRDNISPEREQVVGAPYLLNGISWNDEPFNQWHIWIPTPTEHGTTSCGFGLLYPIALIEIYLRNMYSDNTDFMEMFAGPYRALFMENANNETERFQAESALRNQGAMGYGIFGKDDKLEYMSSSGSGYKSYADFDQRMEKKISKIILGHSDAIDSIAGKLGSGQGGGGTKGMDHSPQKEALIETMSSDANFITPIINNQLLTRVRYHGINIPENLEFRFLNDEEEWDITRQKNETNLLLAQISQYSASGGLEVDPQYFEETTGIKVTKKIAK